VIPHTSSPKTVGAAAAEVGLLLGCGAATGCELPQAARASPAARVAKAMGVFIVLQLSSGTRGELLKPGALQGVRQSGGCKMTGCEIGTVFRWRFASQSNSTMR
jgi:hypothetical protein